MAKKYDTIVCIGRFQPVHDAHVEMFRRASELADQVIIIVGSTSQPRTYKNPWTYGERYDMIMSVCHDLRIEVRISPNIDSPYNDTAWAQRVQGIVNYNTLPNDRIGIIGHKKDESSFYLDMFPQWELEEIDLIQPLNATHIRDLYFRENSNMNFLNGVIPDKIRDYLKDFKNTEHFNQILRERNFIQTYKRQFEGLAYPPVFVTVDSVLFCSGHVLLIKRKSEPGRGLWALPGGFFNALTDKSIKSAMIRELKEETGIKIPVPVLLGSITDQDVFDHPDRSARGRTITHAFKINLADGPLPKVKGMDDAEKAQWIPLADLDPCTMFEDHYSIIERFI